MARVRGGRARRQAVARTAAGPGPEGTGDIWNFYLDMMADCQGRVWTNRQICENSANSYYIGVVKYGHPAKGQTISTTPNSNTR